MCSLCWNTGLRRRQGLRFILGQSSRLPGPQGRIITPVKSAAQIPATSNTSAPNFGKEGI